MSRRNIKRILTKPGYDITPHKNKSTINMRRSKPHHVTNQIQRFNLDTQFLPRTSDRVFIIGGGPSTTTIDLKLLKGEDVICINKAIDLIDEPTYFITMDYSFFGKSNLTIKQITEKAKSSHFILNREHPYIQVRGAVVTDTRIGFTYDQLYLFSSVINSYKTIDEDTGFGLDVSNFAHGTNSGFTAIQFAILAGYTNIYLIGFDLTTSNGKTHFHNAYKQDERWFTRRLESYKDIFRRAFKLVQDNTNIKITTLTGSPIIEEMLPSEQLNNIAMKNRVKIKKQLPSIDNLMVVAYFTHNTPYEIESKRLIKSLNKLKLNYDVVSIESLGNWQANTRYKAKFMEDMLKKYPDKNLLYVDVDAVIHTVPVLFRNYDADIAVRWQDFRWRKNECLSGTIYMANNERTLELCRRWQNINKKEGPHAKTFEQWNLGSVIEQMRKEGKIKDKNLPPEYTFIFDIMRGIYPNAVPVIEHFQASRKLRNKV